MKNTMEYKGYTGSVEYSETDDCLYGSIIGINDIITYEGSSVAEIKRDFEETIDWYLKECAATGKQPDKPCMGKIIVEIEPVLHAKLLLQANAAGISLNELVNIKLAREAV